jgi:hypothetical protein
LWLCLQCLRAHNIVCESQVMGVVGCGVGFRGCCWCTSLGALWLGLQCLRAQYVMCESQVMGVMWVSGVGAEARVHQVVRKAVLVATQRCESQVMNVLWVSGAGSEARWIRL